MWYEVLFPDASPGQNKRTLRISLVTTRMYHVVQGSVTAISDRAGSSAKNDSVLQVQLTIVTATLRSSFASYRRTLEVAV